MANIQEVVDFWTTRTETMGGWRVAVDGVVPKQGGCGDIYELPDLTERPNESFAIADMSDLEVAEPHYHPDGVTEIYIVLEGAGLTVVGREERRISKGDVVITPPNHSHFTIPAGNLVMAVINTPPFQEGDYISVAETNEAVLFNRDQFERLTNEAA